MIDNDFLKRLRESYSGSGTKLQAAALQRFLNRFYTDENFVSLEEDFYKTFSSLAKNTNYQTYHLSFSGKNPNSNFAWTKNQQGARATNIATLRTAISEVLKNPDNLFSAENIQEIMKINTELNNIAGSSKGSVKDLFKQYNRVIAKNFGAQLESFKGTAFERSLATLVAYGQKMGANLAANLVKDVQRGKQPGPRANSMVTGDILQSRLSEENAISLAEEIRKALPENCAEEIVDDFIKGLLTSSIEVKSQKSDVTTESVSIQITDKLSVKIDELRISAKAWNNAQWSWFSNFGETDVLNGIRRSGATGDFILSVARNINPSDHTIAKQMIAADIILGYGQKSFGGDANFVIIRDQSQSGTNNMIRVISAQEIINRISAIGQREDGIIGYYPNLWIKESTVALSLSAMAATKVKIASNFLVDKV